jgi:hypothetical protein
LQKWVENGNGKGTHGEQTMTIVKDIVGFTTVLGLIVTAVMIVA